MCGITFVFGSDHDKEAYRASIAHRGPDNTSFVQSKHGLFVFHRLSINDPLNGAQPFVSDDAVLMCNGEIYNHRELERKYDVQPDTGSDCEVLLWILKHTSRSDLPNVFKRLDAEFACVYADNDGVVVARDPMGVRPLYVAYGHNGEIVGFSSEAKGLLLEQNTQKIKTIEQVPPGTYYHSCDSVSFRPYGVLTLPLYNKLNNNMNTENGLDFEKHVRAVRVFLTDAVKRRVRMSERPVAFFLSGGLDSSIIAAVGAKLSKQQQRITTYSIGIRGSRSPDLEAARIMADHIGSNHVEVTFDPEHAIAQVSRVVKQLESYDCTTIRASVPMFLLAEHVARFSEHRVILSGEGADELFGGYLYFHNAPSNETFHDETIRLLKNIHQFDGLRADRCTAAHGLEVRVPFLDPVLVEYVTTEIHPSMKNPKENDGVEKRVLREAFKDLLPPEILNRQKNGMSDAVGYAWVDHLRAFAAEQQSQTNCCNDDPQASASTIKKHTYSVNPPLTDEERWYREIYHTYYPDDLVVSHESIWRPKWSQDVTDPSARQLTNVFKA